MRVALIISTGGRSLFFPRKDLRWVGEKFAGSLTTESTKSEL